MNKILKNFIIASTFYIFSSNLLAVEQFNNYLNKGKFNFETKLTPITWNKKYNELFSTFYEVPNNYVENVLDDKVVLIKVFDSGFIFIILSTTNGINSLKEMEQLGAQNNIEIKRLSKVIQGESRTFLYFEDRSGQVVEKLGRLDYTCEMHTIVNGYFCSLLSHGDSFQNAKKNYENEKDTFINFMESLEYSPDEFTPDSA